MAHHVGLTWANRYHQSHGTWHLEHWKIEAETHSKHQRKLNFVLHISRFVHGHGFKVPETLRQDETELRLAWFAIPRHCHVIHYSAAKANAASYWSVRDQLNQYKQQSSTNLWSRGRCCHAQRLFAHPLWPRSPFLPSSHLLRRGGA